VRIALISETWLPSVDGVVTRLRHTVSNLIDAGHLVLMIAATLGPPMPGLVQQQIRGIVVPIIDPVRRWALPDRRTIARALDAFAPDVVHVVNPILMGSHALRQVTGRYPVVASFHTDVSAYAARYHLGWTRPILHSITRKAYWRADRRLATSATGLARLAELAVDDASIWPPGVDERLFVRRVVRSREPDRRPSAVYVGRLAREKNCDTLVGLMTMAGTAPSPIRLTFVGDGPDRQRLERAFAGTSTTFAGLLPDGALAAAYAAADVLLFPSVPETVGLVLIEAMAADLPVVAVDTSAVRNTTDGYARSVFVPVDATPQAWLAGILAALATQPSTMSFSASKSDASSRSWQQATDILLSHYVSTIGAFGHGVSTSDG
jgi:glycosyltransferase involved in cell wall biosynthesis